ncbi:hypothetical protein QTI17_34575 [Variovorax sp. J31P179]|uniref:nucleotide-binding protein n=1 Tax=Variovorax sp. J31P179 TaxID=3053508 RepID=UPI0025750C7B|nr:hypothetical protein [Variovorax sp. J31P179]MDM0085716.1 hypothetical protein [Variovorax sp. J31P179]
MAGRALGSSRILMPLWSGTYVASKWCAQELAHKLGREQNTRLRSVAKPHGLVVPAFIHDGEKFPPELGHISYFQIQICFIVRMARNSPRAEELDATLANQAPAISHCIHAAHGTPAGLQRRKKHWSPFSIGRSRRNLRCPDSLPTEAVMGTIVTFYSYKGSVGRSMALANVALLLAQRGLRVLGVDWDLKASRLERYFSIFDEREGSPGLLRAFSDAVDRGASQVDYRAYWFTWPSIPEYRSRCSTAGATMTLTTLAGSKPSTGRHSSASTRAAPSLRRCARAGAKTSTSS